MARGRLVTIATIALVSILNVGNPAAFAGAPLGYQLMCLKSPELCTGGGASSITLNNRQLAQLEIVNNLINRSIAPRRDPPGTDVWAIGVTSGDCEDYALAKRATLIRSGFAPSALRLAYVTTSRGTEHAVLIVKSNMGDLVLDNLTSVIKPLSKTGLHLISIASADPLKWS